MSEQHSGRSVEGAAQVVMRDEVAFMDYALNNAFHVSEAMGLLNARGWMGGEATRDDVRDLIRRSGREERAEARWRVGGECEQYVADYVLANTGSLAEAVELLNARGSRYAMGTPQEREIRAGDVIELMRNTRRWEPMVTRWLVERGHRVNSEVNDPFQQLLVWQQLLAHQEG